MHKKVCPVYYKADFRQILGKYYNIDLWEYEGTF